MKINENMRSVIETKRVQTSPKGKRSFDQIVQSQTSKLNEQALKHLMDEISLQGDRLNRSQTVRDLVIFKRLIKNFLEETVYKGWKLESSHQFNFHGESQRHSIVKEIDEKLVELTEQIIHQEQKSVNLLDIIGEIKGLLVNLYT